MRISIREQLGLLVLVCSLVALAVIAVATWVTNYNFVLGIQLSGLSLTASLYSQQLSSDLLLLETTIDAITTRVLIQNALSRYRNGNDTAANWVNARSDLTVALSGGGAAEYVIQGRVSANQEAGRFGVMNITGSTVSGTPVALPYSYPNGSAVLLGDAGIGYPPNLYPNLTFSAGQPTMDGEAVGADSELFIGPWQINSTFALASITLPIHNNTSYTDILGWLTVIVDCTLLIDVANSVEGLGNTGVILVVGPAMIHNKFPPGILFDSLPRSSEDVVDQDLVRFVFPPLRNSSRSLRHPETVFGSPPYLFPLQDFPAVENAVTVNTGDNDVSNADSLFDTTNEQNDSVSTGSALVRSALLEWVVVVEQDYSDVAQPIHYMRTVLVACVFGTTGALLLVTFPLAHLSVRPIRRLRAATKKTVDPYGFSSADDESVRSSLSRSPGNGDGDVAGLAEMARKEGFFDRLKRWHKDDLKDGHDRASRMRRITFRIPGKVPDRKHFIQDELTDLTRTFNEMSEELMMQYERLEERVRERTEQLEISKKAAEVANESKTLFIANISHELKTPLNGILGMCAVCMHEEDPVKIKRSLGIIYKSGDLLLHLLNDLLTFSKNEVGQQLALEEREFQLSDISSQVKSIFEKQALDGSIKLHVLFEGPHESLDIASGTPAQPGHGPSGTGRVKDMCVWGDQHRILQVVINLVSNSLKFTPPGGSVIVRIKCTGEAEIEKPPSSRKESKGSKVQPSPSSGSRARSKVASSTNSASGPVQSPAGPDGEWAHKASGSAESKGQSLVKHGSQTTVPERSSSPPPVNARKLIFEFEVEDTGPGIPVSQHRSIFQPFVQGDLGLSKKYGGTGLGLSICSQLAARMKGSITLRSQEGVGSTFVMRIPLGFIKERTDSMTESSAGASQRNSIANSLNGESSPPIVGAIGAVGSPVVNGFESPVSKPRLVGLSQPFFATSPSLEPSKHPIVAMEHAAALAKSGVKVKVLVAEDNTVNQEVVLRMLKLEDIYDVTVAKDGQEAFELVKESMEQKNLYDLIFMDIQMPILDGLQSTRLIRGMGYSAPIVALTAFAEESNVKECMDSGMNYFLPKPIRRPALKQVLKKYCPTIPEAAEEPESPLVPETSAKPNEPVSNKVVSPMQ